MTDRYENIRRSLDVIDECADGTLLMTRDRCARLRKAADTIRELLAERDQLSAALEAAREEREALLNALRQIAEWPDGGSRYGQEKIKRFAQHAIDAAIAAAQRPAEDGCHCGTCTCNPNMTPAVRFDLSPAQQEGAIREYLIRLGWAPPDEVEALRAEVERLQEVVRPKRENECLTLDHWRMRAYDLEANWSRCSRACAIEQDKREQAEARAERLAEELRNSADALERLAFAIRAPNAHTPQLVELAISMRAATLAQEDRNV